MNDLISWVRLSQTERVGPVTFKQLLEHYGTPANALENISELAKRGGRNKPLTPPTVTAVEKHLKHCQKLGVQVLTSHHANYPPLLKHINDAPPILYVIGNIKLAQRQTVAFVGARNASANAQTFTRTLAAELGRENITVISGLARGLDTAAHQASLATGTIAVLGGGIDHIYPLDNKKLYQDIATKGCIVSEYPPGMVPKAQHFPRRNRIISGIAQAVVVVEAAKRSGSLITARLAAEQGRDVLAVPGSPQDPRCQGTNGLLKNGATFVENANDILETLSPIPEQEQDSLFQKAKTPSNLKNLNDNQFDYKPAPKNPVQDAALVAEWRDKITESLSPTPVGVTELTEATGAPVKVVHVVLLELYLAGKVEHHPGGKVALLV